MAPGLARCSVLCHLNDSFAMFGLEKIPRKEGLNRTTSWIAFRPWPPRARLRRASTSRCHHQWTWRNSTLAAGLSAFPTKPAQAFFAGFTNGLDDRCPCLRQSILWPQWSGQFDATDASHCWTSLSVPPNFCLRKLSEEVDGAEKLVSPRLPWSASAQLPRAEDAPTCAKKMQTSPIRCVGGIIRVCLSRVITSCARSSKKEGLASGTRCSTPAAFLAPSTEALFSSLLQQPMGLLRHHTRPRRSCRWGSVPAHRP